MTAQTLFNLFRDFIGLINEKLGDEEKDLRKKYVEQSRHYKRFLATKFFVTPAGAGYNKGGYNHLIDLDHEFDEKHFSRYYIEFMIKEGYLKPEGFKG